MKKLWIYLAFLACPFLTACGQQLAGGEWPQDDNPRKELMLSAAQKQYVSAGDAFSMQFLSQINAAEKKDYIISPLSMQFLLGMLLDGAREETAAEIASVLGYGAGELQAVNEYCKAMLAQLPALDKKTKILIADAIYVDQGFELLEDYKTTVSQYYDAEVSNLDFKDAKGSADIINKWCSDHTEKLIDHILDETSPDILCYLLNALYFKSSWSDKFNADLTREEKFTRESGVSGKVPMMKRHGEYRYGEGTSYNAVRLPYGNNAYAMTVLLPKEGKKVADVAEELALGGSKGLYDKLYPAEVDLWLPKFSTKFNIKLNDILSAMGMGRAFDPDRADFKAMSPDALCLSFVRQDAVIKVDEEGTEAAAVSSAGIVKETSIGPSRYVVFHADHPFLYLITESSTGAVLFAGRFGNEN